MPKPSPRDEAMNEAVRKYAKSKGHKRLTDLPHKELESFVLSWVKDNWHHYTRTGQLRKG